LKKLGKKTTNMPLLIAIAVIFSVVGATGAWMWTEGDYSLGYSAGMAYQQSLVDTTKPASMSTSIASSTFADFSSEVAADGSVSAEIDKSTNITITNDDDDRTAGDVNVILYNPVNDKEGLDDDLEVDSTEYTVISGGGAYKLMHDGEYVTNGFLVGDIPPGGEWTIHQKMTLEIASAGTYEDGQSYACHIYVYQGDADYSDVIDFTVAT